MNTIRAMIVGLMLAAGCGGAPIDDDQPIACEIQDDCPHYYCCAGKSCPGDKPGFCRSVQETW